MDIYNVNMLSLIILALLMLPIYGQIPTFTKERNGTMRNNQRWIFSDIYRCGLIYYQGPRNALGSVQKYDIQRDPNAYVSEYQNLDLNASDELDLGKYNSSRVTQDTSISDQPVSDKPVRDQLDLHTNLNDQADMETYINDMTDRDSYVDNLSVLNEDRKDELELDKILGGRYSGIGETPWQVNIKTKVGYGYPGIFKHRCGGVIIAEYYVLTAAHCIFGKMTNQVKVVVGDWATGRQDGGEQVHDTQFLIPHENYRSGDYHDDIGIIKIKPKNSWGIDFNDHVQPVCLPTGKDDPKVDESVIFSGYGILSPEYDVYADVLKRSNLPVVDQETCKKVYTPSQITDKVFCAGAVNGDSDVCYGDYGGPAVFKRGRAYTLYGIASFGDGCKMPNNPAVFTRVSAYIPWIQRAIMHFGESVAEQTTPGRPS